MDEHDEIYGHERSDRLRRLLRAFAAQVHDLDAAGRLLDNVPQLLRQLGEIRSELFHYEVRSTYDTPEVARNRKIVEDAKGGGDSLFDDDSEEEEPWRRRGPE